MHNATKLLRELVAIPSVNSFGQQTSDPIYSEASLVDFLCDKLGKLGFSIKIYNQNPLHPSFVAYLDLGKEETVAFDAHLDTVSHLEMSIDPFDPKINNDQLYGRGSCDTKSNMAIYVSAVEDLLKCKSQITKNILIIGCSDEEFSFGGIAEVAKEGISADFAIIGEPTELQALHAHKGVLRFNISTEGLACHSSTPELGRNAIYDISRISLLLEQYHQKIQAKKHPILGSPSLSVGLIKGGTTVNTVPPSASIEIDRRLIPGENPDEIIQEIQTLVSTIPGAKLSTPHVCSKGFHIEQNSSVADKLGHACSCHNHQLLFTHAAFGTHAPFYSESSIPSLVFGPGSINKAHSKDEFVPLGELEKAYDIIKTILTK
ncbi:M20/M25/M40 family metallo-hydrolase [Lentisphaera marina]|uniref:M20/M25/M40 family metallo-hydrolase n=1 Tax=Lentisphaera marina TaxID=1111041 RepID=UPI0023654D0C|nr:M20/M25/M40 family metallo-hydrolase [Lentisphaera marina]MDD7985929.1 M20/M25/M40 family metallo-hydrolase [Lentisphaera marina]